MCEMSLKGWVEFKYFKGRTKCDGKVPNLRGRTWRPEKESQKRRQKLLPISSRSQNRRLLGDIRWDQRERGGRTGDGDGTHSLCCKGWDHQRRALFAQAQERKFICGRLLTSVFSPPYPDTRWTCQRIAEVNHLPRAMILIAPSEELPDNLSSWRAVSPSLSSAAASWASASSRGAGGRRVARPAAPAICRTAQRGLATLEVARAAQRCSHMLFCFSFLERQNSHLQDTPRNSKSRDCLCPLKTKGIRIYLKSTVTHRQSVWTKTFSGATEWRVSLRIEEVGDSHSKKKIKTNKKPPKACNDEYSRVAWEASFPAKVKIHTEF